jgi:hypothetical protein
MRGITAPYQPVERRLQLTQRCLEVLAEFCNPVVIVEPHAKLKPPWVAIKAWRATSELMR